METGLKIIPCSSGWAASFPGAVLPEEAWAACNECSCFRRQLFFDCVFFFFPPFVICELFKVLPQSL